VPPEPLVLLLQLRDLVLQLVGVRLRPHPNTNASSSPQIFYMSI
jgi:hypothetical protein